MAIIYILFGILFILGSIGMFVCSFYIIKSINSFFFKLLVMSAFIAFAFTLACAGVESIMHAVDRSAFFFG